jgi:hypothetical protein
MMFLSVIGAAAAIVRRRGGSLSPLADIPTLFDANATAKALRRKRSDAAASGVGVC